ncbi:nuclease-related domain-containing protein [Cryobacterium zongtaii]|nr:nuclease-related domain-containing protein [Cryobacterium zongtaii]
MAVYERQTKTVTCVECPTRPPHAAPEVASPSLALPPDGSHATGPELRAESVEVFTGTAGASAKREYERRRDRRDSRIRDEHPYLGKLILAVTDEPQSTRAWATGARGEEALGQRLDKLRLSHPGVYVLHDRRIPRTTANIDHIAVSAAGVFVIDAKKYQGRPSLRVEGGLFRPRTENLMVGSRDCTKQVNGVHKQVDLVRSALKSAGLEQIPVHGVLCFVDADWPLIGGAFIVDGVHVLWPRKAVDNLLKPGELNDQGAQHIHRTLASSFPPA